MHLFRDFFFRFIFFNKKGESQIYLIVEYKRVHSLVFLEQITTDALHSVYSIRKIANL